MSVKSDIAKEICDNCYEWDECMGSGNDLVYCNGHNFTTADQLCNLIASSLPEMSEEDMDDVITNVKDCNKRLGTLMIEAYQEKIRKELEV